MKSFRGEREKKNALVKIILTILMLLTSILLANYLPSDVEGRDSQTQKTTWESSVVLVP